MACKFTEERRPAFIALDVRVYFYSAAHTPRHEFQMAVPLDGLPAPDDDPGRGPSATNALCPQRG